MRYLGAIGLLAECAVHVPDDMRNQIEHAIQDACEASGGTLFYRRILDRFEVEVVEFAR